MLHMEVNRSQRASHVERIYAKVFELIRALTKKTELVLCHGKIRQRTKRSVYSVTMRAHVRAIG